MCSFCVSKGRQCFGGIALKDGSIQHLTNKGSVVERVAKKLRRMKAPKAGR